jgi:hypothetical protein
VVDSETAAQAIAYDRYKCPVCGDGAESLAAKKAHIRSTHPRSKKVRRG